MQAALREEGDGVGACPSVSLSSHTYVADPRDFARWLKDTVFGLTFSEESAA